MEEKAKLLNQVLFLSSLEEKHMELIREPEPGTTINSFVKTCDQSEFVFSALLGPMFLKPERKESVNSESIRAAIKHTQGSDSSAFNV